MLYKYANWLKDKEVTLINNSSKDYKNLIIFQLKSLWYTGKIMPLTFQEVDPLLSLIEQI